MKTPVHQSASMAIASENADVSLSEEPATHDSTHADTMPFTRSAIASVLQVSVTAVRRWEGTVLHPMKGPDGIYLFDPTEAQELAKRRPTPSPAKNSTAEGEVAATASRCSRRRSRPETS